MDDKKRKKESPFKLSLGSCQPFTVPWVEEKTEILENLRALHLPPSPCSPNVSEMKSLLVPSQATSRRRTSFPWKSTASRSQVEGRCGKWAAATHKPWLLLCHQPTTAPEQAAGALVLLPYTCHYASQHRDHAFPSNFYSELGLPKFYTEREKGKETVNPLEKQTGSDLFSAALGHLQASHLGVSTKGVGLSGKLAWAKAGQELSAPSSLLQLLAWATNL